MTWSAACEAFTAMGTVAMAITTGWVIRQNKNHHRDSFRPICVLVPEDGLEQFARGEIVQRHEEPNAPVKSYYRVKCGMKNVGGGPALHLRLMIRFPMNPVASGLEPLLEFAPLGAGQSFDSPILLPVRLHEGFNASDFRFAADAAWELWLEYCDLFGRPFKTLHVKTPQQPWTELFNSGRIANGK